MKSFVLASFLATAFALPEVTIKELPSTCSSYPGYDNETTVAGPWVLQLVDSENTAIEGFSNTNVYSISVSGGTPSLRWGYITIPTGNDIAKTPLECTNGTLHARVANDLTAAGAPTNYQWTPLVLSPYPYDASLMYKITGGVPVQAYEHYVGEEKQDGVFIGGYNTTTWGFTYQPANAGSSRQDYYYMRLLGADSGALQANETRGFIKVYGS